MKLVYDIAWTYLTPLDNEDGSLLNLLVRRNTQLANGQIDLYCFSFIIDKMEEAFEDIDQ
jgi:hypothetical protein